MKKGRVKAKFRVTITYTCDVCPYSGTLKLEERFWKDASDPATMTKVKVRVEELKG